MNSIKEKLDKIEHDSQGWCDTSTNTLALQAVKIARDLETKNAKLRKEARRLKKTISGLRLDLEEM